MKPADAPSAAPPASVRLWLARSLAWAMHTSAWLVLGALGQRHLPLWAGGLLPVALWLGLLGLTLHARAGQPLAAQTVRVAWLAGACLQVLAWVAATQAASSPSLAPLLVSAGFAAWAAAASWTVRLLRSPQRAPLHHALAPAVLGVALAGWLGVPWLLGARDLADGSAGFPLGAGVVLLLAAAAGAALALHRGPVTRACRHGLFDEWRALQGAHASGWRLSRLLAVDAPQRLAALAMLPMMAGLSALLAFCSQAGTGAAAVAWLHLAAMVVPAALLGLPARWRAVLTPAWLCAALLVGGGLALLAQPLLSGLMTASLLHAAAWSVAWAAGLAQPTVQRSGRPGPPAARWAALYPAVAVLALGAALAWLGPLVLWLAHAALAVLALGWMASRIVASRVPAAHF